MKVNLIIMCLYLYTTAVFANTSLYEQMLPVNTPALTPGKVVTQQTGTNVPRPLFIVGDDALSHRWLTAYYPQLKKMNAIGLIVNVRTPHGLQRFNQYPLQMYPVPGHDFVKTFSLKHYPVLIHNENITQSIK